MLVCVFYKGAFTLIYILIVYILLINNKNDLIYILKPKFTNSH